jgi:glycosyltransferase involved in cell wall biosynthesis
MERVLHINDYPPDAGGGAEVIMNRSVSLLRERGVEVDVFTSADLPDSSITPMGYLDNASARRALDAKLRAFEPDVVHLHNWYHVLSPGILDTLAQHKHRRPMRVVMTAHDYHLVCPNAGGCWFRWFGGTRESIDEQRLSLTSIATRRWDERTIVHSWLKAAQHAWNYRWHKRQRVIDLVLCPSRFVERLLASTRLPTCWLPHPAPAVSAVLTQRDQPLTFVFAGRVEPEKGLREFLELLPDDFDGRMTVIGDGSDLTRCNAICETRGWHDRVAFLGRLSHERTLQEIARCHVLVQPSRVLESYGLTLIEALAVGTNLLVTDRGAAREIVDESRVGFLFNVDDGIALRERLNDIRNRHRDGSLNRFKIADFLSSRSENSYVKQLLQHYRTLQKVVRRAA